MIIKAIERKVTDSNIAKELHWAGKSLFDAGAKSMSYDDFGYWDYPPRPNLFKDLLHFGPQPRAVVFYIWPRGRAQLAAVAFKDASASSNSAYSIGRCSCF